VYTMANQELAVVVATIINIYSALAGWLAATRMTSTCIHAPDGRPAWRTLCTRPNQPTNKQKTLLRQCVCLVDTVTVRYPRDAWLHCIALADGRTWNLVAYSTYMYSYIATQCSHNHIGPWRRIATELSLYTI
jgi:hypothetical protein